MGIQRYTRAVSAQADHCLHGAWRLLGVCSPRRCRLYRVAGAEWKQRGTGDVKILKHKVTGKYRVVMRQDKTLKLVANHRLDTASALVGCKSCAHALPLPHPACCEQDGPGCAT
jgi:hypothetical protein